MILGEYKEYIWARVTTDSAKTLTDSTCLINLFYKAIT